MIIHDCVQGSEEWNALRCGKVTASRFSDAMAGGGGVTRNKYMIKLIAERMTGQVEDGYTNSIIERGSDIESQAREYYEALSGCQVQQVGFIERDADTGASPDGLVGADGMIEIKCPLPSTHIRYILEERLPTTYRKQVQGQLWVAGRDWVDFVSYDPRVTQRLFFCERVYRDEDFIKELHIKIVMFIAEMKAMMDKLTLSPF